MATLSVLLIRKYLKNLVRRAATGGTISSHELPAALRAIDALGDGDGTIEFSDIVDALSDYIEDIGDRIGDIIDLLS